MMKSTYLIPYILIIIFSLSSCSNGGSNSQKPQVAINPLAAPQGFFLLPGANEVKMGWDDVLGADYYHVYASQTSPVNTGGTPERAEVQFDPETRKIVFISGGRANGVTHYFVVKAVNEDGEGLASQEISIDNTRFDLNTISDPAWLACLKAKTFGSVEPNFADEVFGTLNCAGKGINDISGVQHLQGVIDLNISNNNIGNAANLVTNLAAFAELGDSFYALHALNISNNGFSPADDLSDIGLLTELTQFISDNNPIDNIDWLANLSNLEVVHLNNSSIGNLQLSALANLKSLRTLSLSDNADITALDGLISDTVSPGLAGLSNLTIRNGGLESLTPLEYLTGLIVLNLTGNNISDTTPLQNLVNLSQLHLANNKIGSPGGNILPLQNLTALTLLNLGNNGITSTTDLSTVLQALGDDTQHPVVLSDLFLDNNAIGDLALQGLQGAFSQLNASLKILSISFAGFIDVAALQGLTKIDRLFLSNNKINNIDGFSVFENITELHLSSNNINDVTPLANLTNMRRLDLSQNAIQALLNGTPNVSTLKTLLKAQSIKLIGNTLMPCSELQELLNFTGWEAINDPNIARPPIDPQVAESGTNCT